MTASDISDEDVLSRAKDILASRLRTSDIEFSSLGDAARYAQILCAGKTREEFWVLYINAANRLITAEMLACGGHSTVNVTPRELARRCLELDATGVAFVHNHPSGTAKPSDDDLKLTVAMMVALMPLEVRVLDHWVVTTEKVCSIRELVSMDKVSQELAQTTAKWKLKAAVSSDLGPLVVAAAL